MFRGVNTLDPFTIDKTYATRVSNVSADHFPALTVKPGVTQVGPTLTGKLTGLGVYKGQELHAIVGGAWWAFKVTPTQIASALNTTAEWTFCNFQGNFTNMTLLAANGVDTPRKWDGTTLSTWANVPAGMKYIDSHDGHVFGVVGNSVKFSSFNKGEDWTDADPYLGAGELKVNTSDGEDINGVFAGNQNLLIFKPSSCYELWGTGKYNFKLENVATDIGILNHKCIAMLGGQPFWMDRNGIYQYGGSRPRDISLPVKEYIKSMALTQSNFACAGSDGTHLYFSIPTNPANAYADTTLEYHKDFQTWTVWKDINPQTFASMGGDLHIAHFDGTSTRVGKKGGTVGFDSTAIPWEWVSAPFGGNSLSQRLRWYRLWYVADVPTGSSMNVYVSASAEGESWTLVKSINGTTDGSGTQSARIIIPVASIANANWMRIRFTGSGPATVHEIDYQQRELPMF